MSHIHKIKDAETHFIIDSTTREISNAGKLPALARGDHNSEVFTFEAPRFVDGHDLTTCNKVKVHYLNIESKTRKPYADIYEVEDLHIDETDETKVVFTWLISKYATQYEGLLNFAIHFNCETDGVIDYAWKTAAFTGITVKGSIDSTEQIMTEYTDILEKWKQDVVEELTGSAGLTEEQEADLAANTEARHGHSNKKTLDMFSCQSLDTGFSQDVSSDELKWRGKIVDFVDGVTASISGVDEIEKDGVKFLRLSLSQGSVIYKKLPDYIDIPVSGVTDVEEKPSPDITLNGSELDFGIPDNSNEIEQLRSDFVSAMNVVQTNINAVAESVGTLGGEVEEIQQAINNINGGIDEIETLIDESGVLE